MKRYSAGLFVVVRALAAGFGKATVMPQSSSDTVEAHVAAAKAAAKQEHTELFNRVCLPPDAQPPVSVTPMSRNQWHAEPVKVFDNLYFVGQTEFSAWAVTTSEGIIIGRRDF